MSKLIGELIALLTGYFLVWFCLNGLFGPHVAWLGIAGLVGLVILWNSYKS